MTETAVSNVSGKEITVSSASGFMVGSLVRFVNDTVGNTLTYRVTNIVSTTITVDTSLTTDSSASNLFLVDYVLFSTNAIIGNEQHNQDTTLRTNVFLEFASRNTGDVEGQTPSSNRVMLLLDTFNIQVSKTSPTIDLYGSALLTGESRTITFDLAASKKNFSGNGIIMEQYITRQYEKDVNELLDGEHPQLAFELDEFRPSVIELNLKKVDIVTSGFPCQAFSVAGYRQGFEDKKGRGNHFFSTAKVIELMQPKAFLLENVKNLAGHDKGNTIKVIQEEVRIKTGN